MSSASSHWRRFVGSCSTSSSIHTQPGNGHLLRKSPSEWQRYSVLLRSCPAARMALLEVLTPVFVDYFVMWWQRHAQSDRPARAMDASNEMLEDLYTAETMLCSLINLLRELVTSPNASEPFVSTVCSWCLARLRPICMVPSTQLLAQLRRLLQSVATAARSRSVNTTTHMNVPRPDSATGSLRGSRPTKSVLDALSRVREGSPFSDGSTTAAASNRFGVASSSDSEVTSDTDIEDDVDDDDELPATTLLTVPAVNESSAINVRMLLDLNPESSANKQLLGSWSRCPLLMEMLHLTYELLLGSCASISTIQALLSSATIPVPPELSSIASYHPPPTAVLPHWVITWLTYQCYRIMYAGTATTTTTTAVAIAPMCRLVRSVLDAATKPPPPSTLSSSSSLPVDTVAGWYGEQRVDVSFWISSCLTHLLFLGDETPALVYNWLVEKLDSFISSEPSMDSLPSFNVFLHVLLRVGLSTVPVPPSVPPTGLDPSGGLSTAAGGNSVPPTTNPPGPPTTNAVFMPPTAAAAVSASDRSTRFPGTMNYTTGFGYHPPDHLSINPAGVMHLSSNAMPPYYLQTLRRPAAVGAGSFPLSNPPPPLALFNVSQPPGPNMHPIPTSSCAVGPPPPFCSNITRPPEAPARLSMHRARRHIRSVDEPATESTPTRRPASLMWLLNLARLLRVAAITALDRALSRLTTTQQCEINLPTVLARLFPDGADRLELSAHSSVLFQLATEMLMTAPAIAGYKNLIVFLFDAIIEQNTPDGDPAVEQKPDSNQHAQLIGSFRTVCARLLQSAAMSCLSMVHSSSELADSLNRGGCDGLLTTVQQLAVPYSPDISSSYPLAHSSNSVSSSSATLFHLLVSPHPHVALIAAHLLVALALTVEPNLSQNILVHLCCSSADNSSCQYTPLLLFFPILDELETGWMARCAQGTDKPASVPWISNELIPRVTNDPISYLPTASVGYRMHELLSDQVLPRLLNLVSNGSMSDDKACSLLRSLVWLVKREEAMVRYRLVRPRLQLALGAQLKPLLTLINNQLHCVEMTDLLLTLSEFAIVSHASKMSSTQNSSSTSGTTHTHDTARGGTWLTTSMADTARSEFQYLPPALAVRAGRQLVCAAAKLLHQTQSRDRANHLESVRVSRQLERIEQALLSLQFHPDSGLLVRSTALRSMVDTENIRLFYPSYQSEIDSTNFKGRRCLRNVDEQLIDTPHLPSSLNATHPFAIPSSGSTLLLFNPAPAASSADDDDVARGYLRAPASSRFNRFSRMIDPSKRPPGTAYNASAVDSFSRKSVPSFFSSDEPQKSLLSCISSPHWLHWLRLTNRLLLSNSAGCLRATSHDRLQASGLHWLAAALQQSLLPHGLHLPQTSIYQLPEQIPLVLPPSGIGLERAIRLMHQFCPEVKAEAIGRSLLHLDETRDAVWLIQSLFHAPLDVVRSLFVNNAQTKGTGMVLLSDPFASPEQAQRPSVQFPYPKLLLGLLMGLEAAWSSPLAPRISIPDAMTYLTSHEGLYAQGVYPVPDAPELRTFYARKLAVDYSQRRVDCRTDLFRFTKHLLMVLFAISHEQDCSTAAQSATSAPAKSANCPTAVDTANFHPHLPLDRLLYCLNPRELSTLLSDVRRNLRLRWAFSWLQDYQKHGKRLQPPLDIVASKTLDALGGSVPPAPGFITPGLLLALLQSHLTEPGVANLVGPLLTAVRLLQPPVATEATVGTVDTDSVVEEIDVNGELMVVLND